MQVKVVDRLPAMRASVDDQPVAAFRNPFLQRKSFRHQQHVSNQRLILRFQVINRVNMPVGNDEDVRGCNGVNITESRDQVITVEVLGRRFAGDYFAEDAGHVYFELRRPENLYWNIESS
jgi:hypothetical protein